MTSYNGATITYDEIGNPLSYYNGASFTWENGRRLATATKGAYTLAFEYNDDGIRTSKTVNGVEHIYHLHGSRIVSEEWGDHLLLYIYDAEGTPIGMQYRKATYAADEFDTYWFEKNLQGDIVAVYSEDGTKLISYTYDAWGNFTITYSNGGAATTATYNPFTYRGYYYDAELELYYLNSRYYDSNTGRFINADVYINANGDILGFNMFAYCGNNPVSRSDTNGALWNVAIGAGIGAVLGGILGGLTAYRSGQNVLLGIAIGAVLGGAVGAIVGVGGAYLLGGVASVAEDLVSDTIATVVSGNNSFDSWEEYAISFTVGGVTSGFSGLSTFKKVIIESAAPLAGQVAQAGIRKDPFDVEQVGYEIITNGLTRSISRGTFSSKIRGNSLDFGLGKASADGFFKGLWKYCR